MLERRYASDSVVPCWKSTLRRWAGSGASAEDASASPWVSDTGPVIRGSTEPEAAAATTAAVPRELSRVPVRERDAVGTRTAGASPATLSVCGTLESWPRVPLESSPTEFNSKSHSAKEKEKPRDCVGSCRDGLTRLPPGDASA
jgi:hypothetical protein